MKTIQGPWKIRKSHVGTDILHISSDLDDSIAAVKYENDALQFQNFQSLLKQLKL